ACPAGGGERRPGDAQRREKPAARHVLGRLGRSGGGGGRLRGRGRHRLRRGGAWRGRLARGRRGSWSGSPVLVRHAATLFVKKITTRDAPCRASSDRSISAGRPERRCIFNRIGRAVNTKA